jgi:fructose-1,6-bisphosphatase/inositol monophosphatase family enzyme
VWVASRKRRCLSPRREGCLRGGGAIVERAWSNRGFGDFWQYCLVAEGALDVAADKLVNVWDYAPLQILIEEAGGRCSTFDGAEPQHRGSFVAANAELHVEVVSLLGSRGDSRAAEPLGSDKFSK